MTSAAQRFAVVGIGNRWRGDDSVGLVVAERLRGRVSDDVGIYEQDGDAIALAEAFSGTEALVIVDSTSSGQDPGTVTRFDASQGTVPEQPFRSSTHLIGLADSLELARALGRLPAHVFVFGIEGEYFNVGDGLSPAVEAAVPHVVEDIAAKLGELDA